VSREPLGPGQRVAGKFTIRALLARGAVASTYHALQDPEREVALKIFHRHLTGTPAGQAALDRAAAINQPLPSDVALPLLERGVDPATGASFFVTALSPYPALLERVQLRPLTPADAARFARNVARTLDGLHAARVVHDALSPCNVFVGAPPHLPVLLADFGANGIRAALRVRDPAAAAWMAPEQHAGRPATAATDAFALALLVFFALTGRSLLPGDDAQLTAGLCAHAPSQLRERVREEGLAISPPIEGVLARALSLKAQDRFASAGELAEELAAVCPGASAPSPPFESKRPPPAPKLPPPPAPRVAPAPGHAPPAPLPPAKGPSTPMAAASDRRPIPRAATGPGNNTPPAPVAAPLRTDAPLELPAAFHEATAPPLRRVVPTQLALAAPGGSSSARSAPPLAPRSASAGAPEAAPSLDLGAMAEAATRGLGEAGTVDLGADGARPLAELLAPPPVLEELLAAPAPIAEPVPLATIEEPVAPPAKQRSRAPRVVGVILGVGALAVGVAAVVTWAMRAPEPRATERAGAAPAEDSAPTASSPRKPRSTGAPATRASARDAPASAAAPSASAPPSAAATSPSARGAASASSTASAQSTAIAPSASAGSEGEAVFVVTCRPACDRIEVDGVVVTSPASVQPGKHAVTGTRRGYDVQGELHVVKAGERLEIFFPLNKK
jgi:serine/threonine-protein kinase